MLTPMAIILRDRPFREVINNNDRSFIKRNRALIKQAKGSSFPLPSCEDAVKGCHL
jgi:hypothetical protein